MAFSGVCLRNSATGILPFFSSPSQGFPTPKPNPNNNNQYNQYFEKHQAIYIEMCFPTPAGIFHSLLTFTFFVIEY
jgi:hypothetical protein